MRKIAIGISGRGPPDPPASYLPLARVPKAKGLGWSGPPAGVVNLTDGGHQSALEPLMSHGHWNSGHIAPRAEGLVPNGAIFNGREAVTAKLKVVVDPTVSGQETLRVTG